MLSPSVALRTVVLEEQREMECIPAVDIRGGKAVRLLRGEFSSETVFGDPLEIAESYVASGARRLHVVDLDAALTGSLVNFDAVVSIATSLGVPVQVGGGVRTFGVAEKLFSAGVDRVVVGTAGVLEDGFLADLSSRFPARVFFGLDHRRVEVDGHVMRELAVRGWTEGSRLDLEGAIAAIEGLPLAGVIVTDITRDGTLSGPDLAGLGDALESTTHSVYASGGVASVTDLEALASLRKGGRALSGVIIGRAFASRALSVEEAVTVCAR